MSKKTKQNPKGAGRKKIDDKLRVVYISVKSTVGVIDANGGKETAREKASAYLEKTAKRKKD